MKKLILYTLVLMYFSKITSVLPNYVEDPVERDTNNLLRILVAEYKNSHRDNFRLDPTEINLLTQLIQTYVSQSLPTQDVERPALKQFRQFCDDKIAGMQDFINDVRRDIQIWN